MGFLMRKLLLIALAGLLLLCVGCNKDNSKNNRQLKLRPDAALPPKSETGIDLYVYSDCEITLADIRYQMFGGDTGNVTLYKANYAEEDANRLLKSKKFKTYATTYRNKSSKIYFKGGKITDKATFKGSAKTIIHVIPGIGWFRIK